MLKAPAAATSLRQYLLRDKNVASKIKAEIILAETANQLYRDSGYNDLISFEEDIARISAMILLIAESAGSLAELGAFSTIAPIRSKLAVIMQASHEKDESFVRYGPIERLKNENDKRVAVYPWRTTKGDIIVKSSANPHVTTMVRFINRTLRAVPKEQAFRVDKDIQDFVVILWILHLAQAIAITELGEYAEELYHIPSKNLKNKLYCMKLAGWVDEYTYDSKTHWYSTSQNDPFTKYSFKEGVVVNDPPRRTAEAGADLVSSLKVLKHVRTFVAGKKLGVS